MTARSARWLRYCRRAAALAAALASIAGCKATPFRVVLVGDSITEGKVSEPAGPAYAVLLAESGRRRRGRGAA